MIKEFQRFSLGVISLCLVLATSGCIPLLIGAAAGAGGIVYVKGAAVKNVDENIGKVHKAGLAALKKLGIFVTDDEVNKHSMVIKAEYEDGKKVLVKAEALTEFVSKVTVRAGVIGDQEESEMILNAIENEL